MSDYQNTNFEIERSRLASDGLTIAPDTLTKEEFLDKCLLKVFRHASKPKISEFEAPKCACTSETRFIFRYVIENVRVARGWGVVFHP